MLNKISDSDTMFGDERAAAAILRATDPANQKYIARNIKGFKATI